LILRLFHHHLVDVEMLVDYGLSESRQRRWHKQLRIVHRKSSMISRNGGEKHSSRHGEGLDALWVSENGVHHLRK
jgi:hypothetical protein